MMNMRETLTWLTLLLMSAAVVRESRRTRREVLRPAAVAPLSAMYSTDVRRYKHDGSQPLVWQDGGQEPVLDLPTAQILRVL